MTDEVNKLIFHMKIMSKKDIAVVFGFDLDDSLEDDDVAACTFILHGLSAILREHQSFVIDKGRHEWENTLPEEALKPVSSTEEILFEADEELIQAIKEQKIIPFKKPKLH